MKVCIVCRREYYPGINCSFYNFPKEGTVNRTKWLLALGKESVPKYTYVCSAHFDPSLIHDNDYTSKKRLKPNAVPSLSPSVPVYRNFIHIDIPKDVVKNPIENLSNSATNLNINGSSTEKKSAQDLEHTTVKTEDSQCWENVTIKTENFQISDSDVINGSSVKRATVQDWEITTVKTENLQISNSDHDSDGLCLNRCVTEGTEKMAENYESESSIHNLFTNHQNREKRKQCIDNIRDNNIGLIPYKKKLYYTIENETRWIDGNDILFKSIRSYENFEGFIAYLRKRARCFHQRCKRRNQKIKSLKQVIKKLKNTERNS